MDKAEPYPTTLRIGLGAEPRALAGGSLPHQPPPGSARMDRGDPYPTTLRIGLGAEPRALAGGSLPHQFVTIFRVHRSDVDGVSRYSGSARDRDGLATPGV